MILKEISDDFLVLGNIAILVRHTGNIGYDFNFRNFLDCKSVVSETDCPVLLHIGAISDYAGVEHMMQDMGFQLLVHEADHVRCSTIEGWYPLLQEKTPYTKVFETLPSLEQLKADFAFPVFIKGNRQTNRHRRSQCIIENPAQYEDLRKAWNRDGVLSWQKAAIRDFVPLQVIDDRSFPDMVPFSFEFRFFFFCGEYLTHGPYWTMARPYALSAREYPEVLELAEWAVRQINVPFVAVDVAKTKAGNWIVIEVNDGQESGYTGVNPITLWKNIANVSRPPLNEAAGAFRERGLQMLREWKRRRVQP